MKIQITALVLAIAPVAANYINEEPSEFNLTRFDRVSVWEKKHIPLNTIAKIKRGKQQLAVTQTPTATPFSITFECDKAVSTTLCNQAKASFQSAADRIAKILNIYKTINIYAEFKSFCNGQALSSCDLARVLGQAASASSFNAKIGTNPTATIPQSLFKQINTQYTISYSKYDIIADFNADFTYYFASSGQPITNSQYDFEYVVCHEITHGLGFDTNWKDWGNVYASTFGASYSALLPDIIYTQSDTSNPSNPVTGWAYPFVFDLFLYDSPSSTDLMSYYNNITKLYSVKSTTLKNAVTNVQYSKTAFDMGKKLYTSATTGSGSIKFKLDISANTTIYVSVSTPKTYDVGSSIAHLDYNTYFGSPEFLMVPNVNGRAGQTLDTIIQNTAAYGTSYGVYGSITTAMLNKMGWPTKFSPNVTSLYVSNPITGDDPSSGAVRMDKLGFSVSLMALLLVLKCF